MQTEPEAAEDAAFTARVLAATTREDLRRVVDLRLCAGFLREAMRKQRLLRIVAACLVAHALVLPVVAYLALRDGPRRELRAAVALSEQPPAKAGPSQAEFPQAQAGFIEESRQGRQALAASGGAWQADNDRRSTRLRLAAAPHGARRP
jgi:hypothetical protein